MRVLGTRPGSACLHSKFSTSRVTCPDCMCVCVSCVTVSTLVEAEADCMCMRVSCVTVCTLVEAEANCTCAICAHLCIACRSWRSTLNLSSALISLFVSFLRQGDSLSRELTISDGLAIRPLTSHYQCQSNRHTGFYMAARNPNSGPYHGRAIMLLTASSHQLQPPDFL